MHRRIDIDHIVRLYRAYAHDLDRVREEQRKLLAPPTSLKAQLDVLEAEITWLLLPGTRPETVRISAPSTAGPPPGSSRP